MRPKTYSTSDIHIAATLLSEGREMTESPTRLQNQFGSRAKAVFHFEDTAELRDIIFGYTNSTIKTSPRELFARLRELKSLVHALFTNG